MKGEIEMKDPYIQENGTLKNLLGITEYDELNKAEADIGLAKLINLDSVSSKKFDLSLLNKVHNHIFKDIFNWAGEYRTVPLYKEEKYFIPGLSIDYAKPSEIKELLEKSLKDLNAINWKGFKDLDDLVKAFTYELVKIWKIHPYRDGNTRTTLAFASLFAREHGFPMNLGMLLEKLSRKKDENGRVVQYSVRDLFVSAAIDAEYVPEPEYLERLIKASIISGRNQKVEVDK